MNSVHNEIIYIKGQLSFIVCCGGGGGDGTLLPLGITLHPRKNQLTTLNTNRRSPAIPQQD